MTFLYLNAYKAITGDIIRVSTTEVINAFMFNLIQSYWPVNFLADLIQVKIDPCFVITRGIEGGDAGARAKRFEHLERFVCFSCDGRANFVLCVNPENFTQALTVDIDTSNRKEVIAYDEPGSVDSTCDAG